MIKKPPSKSQLSSQIESDTRHFLAKGEHIKTIPKGVSSRDEAKSPLKPERWQLEKSSQDRTYLPEVIDALEKRKHEKSAKRKKIAKRPRKRLIYDDFGEPLRWVWVQDE